MRVVFVRQFVHLATHFLSATGVKYVLAELLVSDEPVVDTQVELLLAFLLERIRDVVLVIPWLLPATVPVGVALSLCSSWESRGDPWCTGQISSSPLFRFARSARTCSRRCRRPSMISILCTAFWVPSRAIHTIRCCPHPESFVLILD